MVRTLVLVVLASVCLFIFLDGGASTVELWARRGFFVMLVLGVLGALSIPSVFGFFHKLTFAKYWMFPLLDGHWKAELCTNWPRIRRTYNSAKSGGPPFDALVDPLSDAEEQERFVEADVIIRSSLFMISLTLRTGGAKRVSRTRFVRPLWRSEELPELSYVFEQEDFGALAKTDARKHYGAGIVRYDPTTEALTGEYWNDRREDAGLNTAGTIHMRRMT